MELPFAQLPSLSEFGHYANIKVLNQVLKTSSYCTLAVANYSINIQTVSPEKEDNILQKSGRKPALTKVIYFWGRLQILD